MRVLCELATPEQIRAWARTGAALAPDVKTNLHVHLPPNYSAFESVEQAIELARQQDIRVLGASTYYDFHVYRAFVDLAVQRGVFPICGLEIVLRMDECARAGTLINDPGNPGKMYLCGKGITRFDAMTPTARELLERVRRNDEDRMERMVERIAAIFLDAGVATDLVAQRIIEQIAQRYGCLPSHVVLQERQVAAAFQEALFDRVPAAERSERLTQMFETKPASAPDDPGGIQAEIRTHLMKAGKPAFVEEQFIDFADARRLILELGGIPCYPTLADGAKQICEYERPVAELIGRIQGLGLHCAEFIPVRNTPEVLTKYVLSMRSAGIVVTAGTEHNTPDLLPLAPTCLKGAPIPPAVADVFLEGACVVAAHAFLTLHGECGYVDSDGELCPGYDSVEKRIAAFRVMGAVVLRRYVEKYKKESQ